VTETRVVDRRTGRVLVVDRAQRVLLFQGFDPAVPGRFFWFTPGGGLDPGESVQQGAARELREETGLVIDPAVLGEPIWEEYVEFSFDRALYRQTQHFFRLDVEALEVSTDGFDEIEQRTTVGHRWWSAAELAATEEEIYPPGLDALIAPSRPARG
jgi:8-oxo-dGTP pyrophosphatase MutT (NUDIX family)